MAIVYIDNIDNQKDSIKKLISEIKSNPKYIYLDTETTGLDPFLSKVLLIQIRVFDDIYVINRQLLGEEFSKSLIKLINSVDSVVVGHNIKFDSKMIRTDTGIWLSKLYDTMIAECVLSAGIGKALYSLSELTQKYCGIVLNKKDRLSFTEVTADFSFTEQQITYAATDLVYLEEIVTAQMERAESEKLLDIIDLEMKVVSVVSKMEYQGITLDVPHWLVLTEDAEKVADEISKLLTDKIFERLDKSKYSNALEFANALCIPVKNKRDKVAAESITDIDSVLDWAKRQFNANSTKQMVTSLNLIGVETKDTNAKTLKKLPKDDVIDTILDLREVEKKISTYGRNVIDLINPVTNRIHTDYYQMGTETGRFSSRNPNMQNLPRKGGYREGFISREGFSLISMDYSQQEYRLVGALSKEPKIIEAYVAGSDMHTATASNRFKKPLSEITSEERNFGKTMNFAILYGTTEFGLMRNFSVTKEEALEMLDDFYKGYPKLTAFKNYAEDLIMKLGYSITPLGRRRYFPPLPVFGSPYELEKITSKMKREGFNMIIQGGGADITKIALSRMNIENPFEDLFNPILQIHDEIVCEVHDSILNDGLNFMESCMIGAFKPFLGEIPAKVDHRISKRWGKG